MANEKTKETKKTRKPTAVKRNLQSERKRLRNKHFRSTVKTAMRALETAIKNKEETAKQENLNTLFSLMDKGVKTGVFTKNKANRTKSRLAKTV